MPDLLWLDRIQPSQRPLVGEKAFVLSQLCQQGYPILPGFAIATTVWQQFLMIPGESKPILTDLSGSSLHIDVKNYLALQQLARNICQDIKTVWLPSQWLDEFLLAARKLSTRALILRPSLAISDTFPDPIRGILRSQVCWCEPQSFENALKQVWSELFRAKSLFYWQRAGIELDRIQMAVLVQPIGEAIASGRVVANSTQWQVEALGGLGYSWMQGEVEPETYRVNATTQEIEAQHPGHKTRECYIREKPTLSSSNCLAYRSLREEEQEDYVLDPDVLSQILTLTQKIQGEKSQNCSWEWVLSRAETPQLSLVQWNEEQYVSSPIASAHSLPLVTGVSASPGRAIAPIRILVSADDLNLDTSVGEILVAKTLESYWFPLLKQAAGLVLEQGNLTSHGAILARELGIPALVGAIDATQLLESGEFVLIDGTQGKIYLAEEENKQPIQKKEVEIKKALQPSFSPQSDQYPPIATGLFVNLSQPSSFQPASRLPVDGVGLLRSELMMLELLQAHALTWWLHHPQALIAELTQRLYQLAEVFSPRPVFYRSTDWRSPEFPPLPESPDLALNPLMGVRGTHSYRVNSALFEAELAALKQVSEEWDNCHLILPFVRSLEEFLSAQKQVQQVGLLQRPSFQVWIMAEVPSVIFMLPEYVRAGVQGIAIGSNDLIQLLLGIDREHSQLGRFYNESHPAVAAALEMLIRTAQKEGIPCSLCGQAIVRSPELIDRLIEWGITSISVEPEAVESTYLAIARAERRFLLAEKRKQEE